MSGNCLQVVAVAARKLEDAQAFAKKHSIPKAYGGYEALARDPEIGEFPSHRGQLLFINSCFHLQLLFTYSTLEFIFTFWWTEQSHFFCVRRCGLHWSDSPLPPEHLSAFYQCQEERPV